MPPHANDVRYSDLSPFVELLRTEGRVKILDAFIRKPTTELSSGEVATLADIDPSTFNRNKDTLIELGLIEEIDREGERTKYAINRDKEIVEALASFHLELNRQADTALSELPNSIEAASVAMASALEQSKKSRGNSENDRDSETMQQELAREAGAELHP